MFVMYTEMSGNMSVYAVYCLNVLYMLFGAVSMSVWFLLCVYKSLFYLSGAGDKT